MTAPFVPEYIIARNSGGKNLKRGENIKEVKKTDGVC